jgi:hypothetical protein
MLMQTNYVYTLNDFRDITFGGFDIKLPDKTIDIITELAEQVGSPTYIKTPVFAKREIPLVKEQAFKKKRRGNQGMESVNDEDWESLRTFQATKIEQKVGIEAQFDLIRACLNKITEKTYDDQYTKICDILNQLQTGEEDLLRVGNAIFEIASANRFYSKLYADLYTMLIHKYEVMNDIFKNNMSAFLGLFEKIEYVSADDDYDRFCKNNSDNEKRKALSMFFVNLSITKIIPEETIVEFASNLLKQVLQFIHEDNKKNEVDEMVENIAILFKKETFIKYSNATMNDKSFVETIEELAKSKSKNFASLSNKAIFKFMDMVEM